MEELQKNAQEKDLYPSLKTKILTGAISFSEARDILIAEDQSTSTHEKALSNLSFLCDPEIVSLIQTQSPEIISAHQSLLCITEFHVAQIYAFEENAGALVHFQNAHNAALATGRENDPTYRSWFLYVQGTLLYMSGEKIPNEIINGIKEEANKNIIKRFNEGLEKRGVPAYKEDYIGKK